MGFSRLLSSLTVLSALLFLSLPAASDARSLRQRVVTRSSLDVCATIDESTFSYVELYIPGYHYQSCVNICLCISTLPAAIQSRAELETLAKEYGEDKVKTDLTLLINAAQNREECDYPDNSSPACTPRNPCAFNCESPYVEKDKECVCPAPYKLCNGICGKYPHGCGSAAPHPYSGYGKRLSPELQARSHGVFSNDDALATCRHGETVCGVYKGSSAFECLNTHIALESCKCNPRGIGFFVCGLIWTFRQVVDACLQTPSFSCRSKALKESTARTSLTSTTSAALVAAVLSTAAKKASTLLPIVPNASANTIALSLGSVK
ncbi:hypothetical protein EI94DRAFT_1623640 [Lactarius quietus]|nr:hypothetical protein EI94DRAFT_1623640 [Lactarius quietus]